LHYDDDDYVVNNRIVQNGLSRLASTGRSPLSTPATGIRSPGSRTWPTANAPASIPPPTSSPPMNLETAVEPTKPTKETRHCRTSLFHPEAGCWNGHKIADRAKLKSLESIRHHLELYKNQQPWRESVRATNAPVKD